MRTFGPDNGAILPSSTESDAPTQIVLAFEDNRLASALFGQYGQNLALIERRLGVVADSRGNHVTIEGRLKMSSMQLPMYMLAMTPQKRFAC